METVQSAPEDTIEALREKLAEYDDLFDVCWEADQRAVKRWQAATGEKLIWPDRADLIIFLMQYIDQLEGALEPFAAFAEKAGRFVQGRADFGGSPIMPTKHFRLGDFERARDILKTRPTPPAPDTAPL